MENNNASASFRGSKEMLYTTTNYVMGTTLQWNNCTNSNNSNKSSVLTQSNCSGISSRIKLCGYLKKKRNKVGGWRKMWFVLQDKLLLSYASKEEYDTKLVSFKDVLNLVPGTLVRPLGGFRFTIETTTQAMYTFHCEDRSAYRAWITMLLESLSTQNSSVSHAQKFVQRFGHYSVDNIPSALLTATPISNSANHNANNSNATTNAPLQHCGFSSSFDSITQAQRLPTRTATKTTGFIPKPATPGAPAAVSGCCVRLPIVQNTAKILERNGVKTSDLQQSQQQLLHQQEQQQQQQEAAQVNCKRKITNSRNINLCDLHHFSARYMQLPPKLSAEHNNNKNYSHHLHPTDTQATAKSLSTASTISTSLIPTTTSSGFIETVTHLLHDYVDDVDDDDTYNNDDHHDNDIHPESTVLNVQPEEETNMQLQHTTPTHLIHGLSVPTLSKQCRRCNAEKNCNSKQQHKLQWQWQRVNCDCNYTCMVVKERNAAIEFDSSATEEECKTISMVRERIQRLSIHGTMECNYDVEVLPVNSTSPSEPVHQNPHQLKSKVTRTSSCTEQLLQQCENEIKKNLKSTSDTIRTSEPIYAVVDLKHKYAQRRLRCAKKVDVSLKRCNSYDSILQPNVPVESIGSHKMAHSEKSLSLAEDDIDGIYEDGDIFNQPIQQKNTELVTTENQQLCDNIKDATEDEENIYEPINLPPGTSERTTFWKYFTRLKVNTLLHLTRRMRHKNNPDYDCIKFPPVAISDDLITGSKTTSTTATTSSQSHFSTIKRKFGTHRKSMQVRMRKFCTRAYEPKPFFKRHHQNSDCQSIPVPIDSNSACYAVKFTDSHKSGKLKCRWKSVKLRTRNLQLPVNVADRATTSATHTSRRKSLFGSLPHMRRSRLSLFGTAHQQSHHQLENGAPKNIKNSRSVTLTKDENEL